MELTAFRGAAMAKAGEGTDGAMAAVLAFPCMDEMLRLILVVVVSVAMLIAFAGYVRLFFRVSRSLSTEQDKE